MLNDLVFNICLALVVGICGVIAHELIPYLHEKTYEAMKALEATKWAWTVDIIGEVVRAVEQTVIEQHGEEKKAIAHQMIWKAMKEAGLSLRDEQIDMLIEAAVQAMNEGRIYDGKGTETEGR